MGSPLYLPTPPIPPASGVTLVNAPAGMGVPVSGLSPIGLWAILGGLVFGCVDQSGVEWFFSDIDGWADGTAIALAEQQRGGAHGAWMGTSYLEPRSLTFAGRVRAPSPTLAWQARNVLLGVVASLSSLGIMNVDTALTVNEPDALKSAGVRPADKPVISPIDTGVFTFSIPLTARDPRKYGAAQTAQAYLPVASSGLTFPVGPFGVTFGGTGSSGLAITPNAGNFPMSPVFNIYGPCTNPIVTNTTTGQTIAFSIVLGSSDVLSVDTDLFSVTLNGTTDRANTVLPGSVFPYIVQGSNTWQYGAASYSSLSHLDILYSSVWW